MANAKKSLNTSSSNNSDNHARFIPVDTKTIINWVIQDVSFCKCKGTAKIREFCNNYDIDLRNGIWDDENIAGIIKKDSDNWTLKVNESYSIKQKKFIVAHQLGHWFSYRYKGRSYEIFKKQNCHIDYILNNNPITQEEAEADFEANKIALEILIPENEVRDLFEKNKDKIDYLANFFEVSQLTMIARLQNLGLIHRYFENNLFQ